MFGGLVYGVGCWSGGAGLAEGYGGTDMNEQIEKALEYADMQANAAYGKAIFSMYEWDRNVRDLVDDAIMRALATGRPDEQKACTQAVSELFDGNISERTANSLASMSYQMVSAAVA